MWVYVLCVLLSTLIYIVLGIVWLMLGAIVNPSAFLPYATGAATFVTIMTAKYALFN